ncbi:hypothetical protein SAMN05443575_3279 [Jatrophihabitans endophyticus]|uniref:Uncharacterized protein n=1 Tax=Jatrophihabitans endophyticus TaxID=1206085 RepID=A0A1M5Q4M3_9ACTN|nr:hypothetical protein [Jatrophihabitans endophyticus]SHH08453.1 hypothetical protein SAMN05443575_3279 [Jatrophihabitans endophyticus]
MTGTGRPRATRESLAIDVPPAALDFLQARLADETAAGGRSQAGLAMMRDVIADLHAGATPPPFAVRMLLLAYTRHRDYDPGWTAALDRAARAAGDGPRP